MPNCKNFTLLSAFLCAVVAGAGQAVAFGVPALNGAAYTLPIITVASPEEPEGYRTSNYRAPVPKTLKGATVLRTEQVLELWDAKAARFIDVLPRPPRPAGLAKGTIWRPPARLNIPGSVWLANVGFGKVSPELEAYFKAHLEKISDGDRDAPLVFYCLAKCWMSWNAGKRALSYGYRNVYWYPDGTDGWSIAGRGLETSEPAP